MRHPEVVVAALAWACEHPDQVDMSTFWDEYPDGSEKCCLAGIIARQAGYRPVGLPAILATTGRKMYGQVAHPDLDGNPAAIFDVGARLAGLSYSEARQLFFAHGSLEEAHRQFGILAGRRGRVSAGIPVRRSLIARALDWLESWL